MNECHCVIKHARTPEERGAIRRALEEARVNGDSTGVMICLAQLAPCKSDPVTPEANQPGFSNR